MRAPPQRLGVLPGSLRASGLSGLHQAVCSFAFAPAVPRPGPPPSLLLMRFPLCSPASAGTVHRLVFAASHSAWRGRRSQSQTDARCSEGPCCVACIRMSRREKGTFYYPVLPAPRVRGPVGSGHLWETWVCSIPEAAIAKHQNWVADGNRALLFHSLEARSPNSRCWQGHAPSDSCKGRSFLVSSNFWCFPAILGVP